MSATIAYAETHSVTISSAIEQLSKKQDYICNGMGIDSNTGEKFTWVMLNDGHSTNTCINIIRSIPTGKKSELIGQQDPIAALVKYIDDTKRVFRGELSGATAIIVKIFANRGEVINCGDSQCVVFKDDKVVHITKEHNSFNEIERQRLIRMGCKFDKTSNIKVIASNIMKPVQSEYIVFPTGKRLATSQALGHNSMTGYAPDKYVIPFDHTSKYRFVLGSDGLFDMTMLDSVPDIDILKTKNAEEICQWCTARWLQDWKAHMPDGSVVDFVYNRDQCDDVSVSVVEAIPM